MAKVEARPKPTPEEVEKFKSDLGQWKKQVLEHTKIFEAIKKSYEEGKQKTMRRANNQ